MPIRLAGLQQIATATDAVPGGDSAATVALWVRPLVATHGSGPIFAKEFSTPFHFSSQGPATPGVYSTTFRFAGTSAGGGGSFTLTPNAAQLVVLTLSGSTARATVNGQEVARTSTFAGSIKPGTYKWFLGPGGATADLVVADVTYWRNYVLTDAQILALRDRTTDPTDIEPSAIHLHWSCSGADGDEVIVGDAGITTPAGLGGSRSAASVSGDPVYHADDLLYVAPVRVARAYLGDSRKTLVFEFEDLNSTAVRVTSQSGHPTISVGGGGPIDLGATGGLRTGRDYKLLYPLASAVGEGVDVTYSAAEGWVGTTAGMIGASDEVAVLDEHPDGSLCPPTDFDTFTPTMKFGVNLPQHIYWQPTPTYANILRQASGVTTHTGTPTYTMAADGSLSALSGGTIRAEVLSFVGSDVGDPDKGFPNGPPGHYTLMWDGAGVMRLEATNSKTVVSLVSSNLTGAADNTRVYDVQPASGEWCLRLRAIWESAPVTNPRVFWPDHDIEGHTSIFHPWLLDRLDGYRVLRSMVPMQVNNSSMTSYAQYAAATKFFLGAPAFNVIRRTIASIASYPAGPTEYFGDASYVHFTITTTEPHGFATGEILEFEDSVSGIPLDGGGR